MKRVILLTICMAILFACTTEKVCEPVTEVGFFTPYVFSPEFLNGQVKSVELRSYWTTEENGEFIRGTHITLKERDSIGWSHDFIVLFDSSGLVKKTKYLDDDGEAYAYDKNSIENGKYLSSKRIYKDTARVAGKLSYDDSGNIINVDRFRLPEDTLINSYALTYDENGNWVEGKWTLYNGDAGFTTKLEYNDEGQLIARVNWNADGEKTTSYTYAYDDRGFQIKFEGTRADTSILNLEAKYTLTDEKGNWLEMVSIEDGEVVGMDVRTIEYY